MDGISVKKRDVVWNYIGTVFSMASGFLLLPLLLAFLSADELGLWYVFVAIGNLTLLFEFGFNPTFARNIVYCVSGAKSLSASGRGRAASGGEIDFHLLKALMKTSKLVYAAIALATALLLLAVGTPYVHFITNGASAPDAWIAWAVFCVAMLLNLYFYYALTFLRGLGDVAGENRAKTFAKVAQLATTALLLPLGYGLVGAAIGYLVNGVLLRVFALRAYRKHDDVLAGLAGDHEDVRRSEIRAVFKSVSFIAWRDGVVQLALFASTQGTSILCSLFLGLAETGTYAVMFQFGQATYQLAGAYARSFYPAYQSAFAQGDEVRQREIVSKGLAVHAVSYLAILVCVCLLALPLLPLFKPDISVDYALYAGIAGYLFLWNQHSICCNFIVGMNEIPYMKGYLVAALLGIALSAMLMAVFEFGAWGLVLGQALAQLAYNNWKWPRYLLGKLGMSYLQAIVDGVRLVADRLRAALRRC